MSDDSRNAPVSRNNRRTLKISAGLHKRLKVFAVMRDRGVEELAEEVLDRGLTLILAESGITAEALTEMLLAEGYGQQAQHPRRTGQAEKKPAPSPRRRKS